MQLVSKLYIDPTCSENSESLLQPLWIRSIPQSSQAMQNTDTETSTLAQLYFLRIGTEEILGRILRDLWRFTTPQKLPHNLSIAEIGPPKKGPENLGDSCQCPNRCGDLHWTKTCHFRSWKMSQELSHPTPKPSRLLQAWWWNLDDVVEIGCGHHEILCREYLFTEMCIGIL